MKTDLIILAIVSSSMLIKLSLNQAKGSRINADNFSQVVETPLQYATFLCLVMYMFRCGYKRSSEGTPRGGKFGLPIGLLMTAFKNADFYKLNQKRNFSDKVTGMSILYGSFMAGSFLSKNKGISVDTLKNLMPSQK